MKFYPYAGFAIPKQNNGLITRDKNAIREFWEEVECKDEGLSSAIGIYIFSIRAGRGILPWYVGKAEKRGFISECFQAHKITHFDNCIASRKGTPLLTLIPKFTKNDMFAKPNGNIHSDISTLEKMLIGSCLQKNKDLVNARDTKLFKEMVVNGYLNSPQGGVSNGIKEFKQIIGV